MPKQVTYPGPCTLIVDVDSAGNAIVGRLLFKASNGAIEEVTIGPAIANPAIVFSSLGTVSERAGFKAVLAAAVAAGKAALGDV